jgi:hypothetical protein
MGGMVNPGQGIAMGGMVNPGQGAFSNGPIGSTTNQFALPPDPSLAVSPPRPRDPMAASAPTEIGAYEARRSRPAAAPKPDRKAQTKKAQAKFRDRIPQNAQPRQS